MADITFSASDENISGTIESESFYGNAGLYHGSETYTFPAGGSVKAPETVAGTDVTYNITLKANDKVEIKSAGLRNNVGSYDEFNVSEDKKKATLKDHSGSIQGGVINVETKKVQPDTSGVTGFNNIYMLTEKQLENLKDQRFVMEANALTNDLGKYIINLIQLPFEINSDIQGNEAKIQLGEHLIETKGVLLTDDDMTVNIGKIDIPGKYKNSYDFVNTKVLLHLPFVKTLELDVNYTIQQTIHINYVVDLYSGETTLNVTSTKLDDEVVHNENIRVGKDIPFVKRSGGVIGENSKEKGITNGVYNAFIEVIRNTPYEKDSDFNDDMTLQTKLRNETGYIEVIDGILQSEADSQEKDNIMSILTSGVYIK